MTTLSDIVRIVANRAPQLLLMGGPHVRRLCVSKPGDERRCTPGVCPHEHGRGGSGARSALRSAKNVSAAMRPVLHPMVMGIRRARRCRAGQEKRRGDDCEAPAQTCCLRLRLAHRGVARVALDGIPPGCFVQRCVACEGEHQSQWLPVLVGEERRLGLAARGGRTLLALERRSRAAVRRRRGHPHGHRMSPRSDGGCLRGVKETSLAQVAEEAQLSGHVRCGAGVVERTLQQVHVAPVPVDARPTATALGHPGAHAHAESHPGWCACRHGCSASALGGRSGRIQCVGRGRHGCSAPKERGDRPGQLQGRLGHAPEARKRHERMCC
mmetsp:Transcript_14921/g.40193  ORF Transcript_14921/g.40193 Transcript_14921/m.40193 type:complete len:326 (-) Transcript_14921:452-1429(-)